MKVISAKNKNFDQLLNNLLSKRKNKLRSDYISVKNIIKDVKKNGDKALVKYEKRFNKNKTIVPTSKKIQDTIKSLAIHTKDVGSTEIQIGLLTDKITKLSEHFKKFKKDKHSTLGLTKSVNKRKKLLAYLKKKNSESYQKVIKQLNIRK